MQGVWSRMSVVAVAAFVCAVGVAGGQQSADEAALRRVVEQFYAAYEKKDAATMMSLWSAESPWYAKVKKEVEERTATADFTFTNLVVSRLRLDGNRARLRAAADVKVAGGQTRQTQQDRVLYEIEFVREGAEWKMWRNVSAWKALAEALLKASSEAARAALLGEEQELIKPQLVAAIIGEGSELLNRRDYREALRAAQVANELAEKIQDRSARCSAWLFSGSVQLRLANYDEAAQAYQQCRALSGERTRTAAMAQMGLANVSFQRGDYLRAAEVYEQVSATFHELKDAANRARVLNNLGNAQYELGNYAQALDAYLQSLQEHERLQSNKVLIAETLNNIAVAYAAQANYARALDYLVRARELAEDADKLHNIGVFYKQQGNDEQALHYFQLSLKRSEASGDKAQQARTLRSLGLIYQSQDHAAKALEYYHQSLALSRSLDSRMNVAATQRVIGQLLTREKKFPEALAALTESLSLCRASGNRADTAQVLIAMGRTYLQQGETAQALRCADEATEIARAIERPDHLWRSLELAGSIHFQQGRYDEARRAFDEAATIVERLRQQTVGGEQESQRFFEDKLGPYRGMVKLLVTRGNAPAALAYAERAKARVLLDTLQSGRVNVNKAMSGAEQEHECRLNNAIFSLNTQLQRERLRPAPDTKRVAALTADLQKARLDYEDFQTRLYAAHPELKAQRGEVQPLTPEEATALVADGRTVLLEFAVADEQSYLFVVTPGAGLQANIQAFPVAVTKKEMTERIAQFRKLLAGRDNRYGRPARELYDLLLAPAQGLMRGKAALVIVPDGPLWELPFQALVGTEGRFLLEDYTLSYAPSLTVLREMIKLRRKREAAQETTLLALGNPAFSQSSNQTTSAGRAALMDEKPEPLPDAERQVNRLKGLYGAAQAHVFTGTDATEERFKAEAPGYRVIHLATHGILDDRNPMYSYLTLAPTPGGKEDGLLEAWEILKMDLRADLAVLSACETARGRISAGEGMIGLTWALFVAGVPTTVVSQWKVRSDSTAELMVDFHRRLNAGGEARVSRAEALRRAAIKLLQEKDGAYRHPFYWAGFVVVGDGR